MKFRYAKLIWSRAFGLPLLYQELWQRTGLTEIIQSTTIKRKAQFNIEEAVFCLALNRLVEPKSELGIYAWKDNIFTPSYFFQNLNLQHFYRALDVIEQEKETIETKLF